MKNNEQLMQELYEVVVKNAETYKQTVEGCGRTVGSNILTHLKSIKTLSAKDPGMAEALSKPLNDFIRAVGSTSYNNGTEIGFKFGYIAGAKRGAVIGAIGTLATAGVGKYVINRIKNRKKNEDHYVEVPESHEEYTYINLSETQNENEVKEN